MGWVRIARFEGEPDGHDPRAEMIRNRSLRDDAGRTGAER